MENLFIKFQILRHFILLRNCGNLVYFKDQFSFYKLIGLVNKRNYNLVVLFLLWKWQLSAITGPWVKMKKSDYLPDD